MKRHYYISSELDTLETVEHKLVAAGFTAPQIHVLSEDDAGLERHHLNQVEAVLKKDVVHGTELGAVVGVFGAVIVLALAYLTGISETYTWLPAVFLAVVVLGFCTWEGGLIGIQEPHIDFKRFQNDLKAGRHVLIVDADPDQWPMLNEVANEHIELQDAGEGDPTPKWVVEAQNRFTAFMKVAP